MARLEDGPTIIEEVRKRDPTYVLLAGYVYQYLLDLGDDERHCLIGETVSSEEKELIRSLTSALAARVSYLVPDWEKEIVKAYFTPQNRAGSMIARDYAVLAARSYFYSGHITLDQIGSQISRTTKERVRQIEGKTRSGIGKKLNRYRTKTFLGEQCSLGIVIGENLKRILRESLIGRQIPIYAPAPSDFPDFIRELTRLARENMEVDELFNTIPTRIPFDFDFTYRWLLQYLGDYRNGNLGVNQVLDLLKNYREYLDNLDIPLP